MVFIAILACFVYLGYCIAKQISASKRQAFAISVAQQDYDNAEREERSAKQQLMDAITKTYGQETADDVFYRKIWLGMPIHLLLVSRGRAEDIKESIYRGVSREKWYYGRYQTRLGTYKYRFEITLENNRVVGWKDLT